ncbi:MAG: hypothetical protein Q7K65_05235 [Candidatus Buchananbacteria bacterium]|nr:hypothetical protein [Candidatus Buchananbacteria bacterium]
MDNFLSGLVYLILYLYMEFKSFPGKVKRFIWNRGLKLWWYRLWIRKDEFHKSLDMDKNALLDMNPKQREAYIKDLTIRRQKAHDRDI